MKLLVTSMMLVMSLSVNAEDGFDDEIIEVVVNNAPESKGVLYGSIDIEAHHNIGNNKNLSSLKTLVDVIGEYKFDNGVKVNGNLKGYHDFVYDLENRTIPNGYENEIN
ncbi:MAG: hypothetical protein HOA36_01170, partial [Candidatus Ruthia sp.]|nr:hypothetical protein [Candidatus Ruthturnera sp.]